MSLAQRPNPCDRLFRIYRDEFLDVPISLRDPYDDELYEDVEPYEDDPEKTGLPFSVASKGIPSVFAVCNLLSDMYDI